jgi:hypothetical protein
MATAFISTESRLIGEEMRCKKYYTWTIIILDVDLHLIDGTSSSVENEKLN